MEIRKELKLKVKIDNLEEIKNKMKKIAKYKGKKNYSDFFFVNDNIDKKYEFRLRKSDKLKLITFKILLSSEKIQENENYRFEIDNPEDFIKFIETIGFKISAVIKKSCEIYFYNKIKRVLSKVPDIGNYLELIYNLETNNKTNEEYKEE